MSPTILNRPAPPSPPVAEWEAAAAKYGIPVADRDDIAKYLSTRPELASRLDAAFRVAREEFPPPASLVLRLYRDPDFPDEYVKLGVRDATVGFAELMRVVRLVGDRHDEVFGDLPEAILVSPDLASNEVTP